MKPITRIEQSLAAAVASGEALGCPPKLAGAVRHAVFPGGARVRPQLCLAVARACGDDDPELSEAAATSIELLHCASLVHDDLPCFDDAPVRRGRASVHFAYGESLAVLAGDALIVLAFQTLSEAAARSPLRLAPLFGAISRGVGMPIGLVAGQAWECEPRVVLRDYQRAKTGALFTAATCAGALSAGQPAAPWQALGDWLGQAYQVAEDIRDILGDAPRGGRTAGPDASPRRPGSARALGLEGAIGHFDALVARAIDAIPPCAGAEALRALVRAEAARLVARVPAEPTSSPEASQAV